jgi:hypothetical protein
VKQGEREVVVKLRSAATVRGRVVRAMGAPVQGFTLHVTPQRQSFFASASSTWEFPGERFEVSEVPAEPVMLVVRTAQGEVGEVPLSVAPGSNAEVEVVLRVAAGVRGQVVDAATKAPLSGAMVSIEELRAPNSRRAVEADGRFAFEGLTEGEHTLSIIALGGFRERRSVTLVGGQVLDLGAVGLKQEGGLAPSP